MSWRLLVVLIVFFRPLSGLSSVLEPFDGPPEIWRHNAKLLRNVAVAHSLLMQHQNSVSLIMHLQKDRSL